MRHTMFHPDSPTASLRRNGTFHLCPQPPCVTLAHQPVAWTLKAYTRSPCPETSRCSPESCRRSLESSHFRVTLFTDGLPASRQPPGSSADCYCLRLNTSQPEAGPDPFVCYKPWDTSLSLCPPRAPLRMSLPHYANVQLLFFSNELEVIVPTSEILSKDEP